MSLEDHLFEQRYQKILDVENLGLSAYPGRFTFSHTVREINCSYSALDSDQLEKQPIQVKVCGRLMTVRRQGKAGFCNIQQEGKQLQLYIRQDTVGEKAFTIYKKLDAGDIIGVEGHLFRTRTGALTVRAKSLEFLAKAILPMPEKWHGLQDVEIRYRQRYLDLIANPKVRKVFTQRHQLSASLRQSLEQRGYLEVETPMMHSIYGGALARPFLTHHNALDLDLYLRIAPELYLKRLVIGGFDRVYEINRNFRNEGISKQHNPEFTMLEFYQAYSDYRDLMGLSEELLKEAAAAVHDGKTTVEYDGHKIDFSCLQKLSMKEAIVEFWPERTTAPTIESLEDPELVKNLVLAYGRTKEEKISSPLDTSLGANLLALFERACEPQIIQPSLIYDYPVEASPLAKRKPKDSDWVERFEIYVAGMEIANAYSELNDPREQRHRFLSQLSNDEENPEMPHHIDEDYLRSLCYGMPPTAGEGIGIDRLTMILTNSRSIRDVILFPLLRLEGKIGVADRLKALEDQ